MGFGSGGGKFGSGRSDLDSDLTIDGSVKIKEGSAADADIAGQGQLWVKSDAPNNLYFTDDTGQDVQITANGSLAGVAGSLSGLGSTDNVILRASGTGGETAQGSGVLIDDSNNFTIPTTAKIQFRDTGLFINSSANGQLDVDADTELELTAPTVDIDASTTLTVDTAVFSIDGTDDSNLTVTASGKDLDLAVAGGGTQELRLASAGTGAAAIHLNASAGGIDIDSADMIDIDAADEITIDTTSADGHIAVTSAHTAGQAILISANADAGSILDIDAGIIDIDVQDTISIDAADEIEIATTSADGHITLTSAHTAGVAFHIDANADAASELQIDAGVLDIDVTAGITIDGTTISIDGTDDTNITVTGSAKDLDLAVAGGGTQELRIASAGTGTAAIHLNASAGGIDIDSADMIDIDAADEITITTTSADGHISLVSAHTAGVALHIDADANAGSIVDIDAGILDIDVTGDATIDAASLTVTTDTATFASANSTDPLLVIKNTTNDANGARFHFVKDKGAAGADGDDIGVIDFIADDAAQTQTTFARILAEVSESADSDEAGKLSFFVAESDGTDTALAAGLVLEGEHATNGEVDVTIGAGAASTTTIAGTLTMGSTAAMTNAGLLSVGNQSNITGTGALNSGTITSGFGNVDIGSSSLAAGSLDVSDGNITNVGDIDCDSISVADAANGLQIDASAANTGTAAIVLRDNMAQAFAVVEAGNTYMGFTTTDGSESITIAKDLLVTSDTTTFSSANSADPLVIIKNTTNDANGARLQLVKDRGAAGAANDENGLIQFIGDDANQDQVTFSEIKSQVKVHTNGQEGGKLTLSVAEHDGTLTQGLLIEDGDADGELDVTIGAGASSVTQIAGTLDLGDRNITNVGDIDLDKISVADAASGLLIDASGANTGTAAVILGDNLAQAFAVVETSGGSVTYMGFATTNGSELVTIAKPLEIANGSANGATALLIDNDDTDEIALHIEAANIDADVIQIDADAVTTAHVIDITADALTTGAVLNIGTISKNPIIMDHNYTDSSAATVTCLDIDFDRTNGADTNNTLVGIKLDMDNTDMSGGTNTMKGLVVTPTLINASGTGLATVFGADITVTGGIQGNGTVARGLNVVATDADYNQGIHVTSDSTRTGWNHLKLISSEDSGDYCTVKVGTNGETTIETTDGGAAAAHLNLILDGDLIIKTRSETAAGGGFDISGAVITNVANINGEIITTIQIDLTGLRFTGSAKMIIGEDGVAAAYITRITSAVNGFIYKAELACVEAPAYSSGTPQRDIDLVVNSQSLAESSLWDDATSSATSKLLVNGGIASLGSFADSFGAGIDGLADKYLYLAGGDGAGDDANFSAGKFLIKLYGANIA